MPHTDPEENRAYQREYYRRTRERQLAAKRERYRAEQLAPQQTVTFKKASVEPPAPTSISPELLEAVAAAQRARTRELVGGAELTSEAVYARRRAAFLKNFEAYNKAHNQEMDECMKRFFGL